MLRLVPIVMFAVFVLPTQASAALVASDLNTSGDGLITLDTDTGLEWLDLTLTVNLSVNDVALGGAGGWYAMGFSHATTTQTAALFRNAGGAAVAVGSNSSFVAFNLAPTQQLLALLGCTNSCAVGSGFGLALDPALSGVVYIDNYAIAANNPVVARLVVGGSAWATNASLASSIYGNWLVRPEPVPEPGTALLVGLGLVGLGIRGRVSRPVPLKEGAPCL